MLTRIEINGFKTFEHFSLNLKPFTAIVGANASGKSNLFDALRFLSLLSQTDIRSAMQDLRGLPEELFRRTPTKNFDQMDFAIEVFLQGDGIDPFGRTYEVRAQRLRYELSLALSRDRDGGPRGVQVVREHCAPLSRSEDTAEYLNKKKISYNSRVSPFIRIGDNGDALEIRQDGRQRHGRPVSLSLNEASRTALSTVTTAEFPHLFALKDFLSNIRFLEINPTAARGANDRFEERHLKPDASNLSAVLARLKEETSSDIRPEGVLSDIASDLSSLIPSVSNIRLEDDSAQRRYSFSLEFSDTLNFSSRVISDGTLRLLALLTFLNDPKRSGTLCFEEPENGVHEGRVPTLIEFLREASELFGDDTGPPFQVLINTHSPKVMSSLLDAEIAVADSVIDINAEDFSKASRTRMRTGVVSQVDLFNPETDLTRAEIQRLLQKTNDAA